MHATDFWKSVVPGTPARSRVLKLDVYVGVRKVSRRLVCASGSQTFMCIRIPTHLLWVLYKSDWPPNENLWIVRLLKAYFAKTENPALNKGPEISWCQGPCQMRSQHQLRRWAHRTGNISRESSRKEVKCQQQWGGASKLKVVSTSGTPVFTWIKAISHSLAPCDVHITHKKGKTFFQHATNNFNAKNDFNPQIFGEGVISKIV